MNIEEIDKWLDNEYGVSYTRLEELHDFVVEQNMKYQDKIEQLQQENQQLKELKYKFFDNSGDEESFTLEDYLEISNELYDYEQENKKLKEDKKKAIEYIKGHTDKLKTIRVPKIDFDYNELLAILGDKENE